MQIAFWSNYHGQPGTTSSAIATALSLTTNFNLKVLLCSMQYNKNNMDSAFLNGQELSESESGVDAIERVARAKDLNEENFKFYTTTLIKDRLDFLISSSKVSYDLFSKINESVKDIFYTANKLYDFVIVDVNAGMENEVTQKVLKESDIVIVNLSQNEKVIGDFFYKDKKQLEKSISENRMLINIGNYDSKIKCSRKYINKFYKNKIDIFYTPYNSSFKDSINNHKVIDYFKINVNKENENEFFFEEVEKMANKLMTINDKKAEILKEPVKKVTFAQRFKSILDI